jgi:hypothetical protein
MRWMAVESTAGISASLLLSLMDVNARQPDVLRFFVMAGLTHVMYRRRVRASALRGDLSIGLER